MSRVLIFDVDGTLTLSGQKADPLFVEFLMSFWAAENCYLVTGSNMAKLQGQLPAKLLNLAKGVFTCSGNEFVSGERTHFVMNHSFPDELIQYCKQLIDLSPFCWRTGNHIDRRSGMLNVSVAGRNADRLDRQRYVDFDKVAHEREYLTESIMRVFPDYEATLGGQISIDIAPKGWNKGRVYSEIRQRHPESEMIFFGDRMDAGGNDLPLAEKLMSDGQTAHHVNGFNETWKILRDDLGFGSQFRAVG